VKKIRFIIVFFIFVGVGLKPALTLSQDPALLRFERIRSTPRIKSQLEKMVQDAVVVVFEGRAGLKPAPTILVDPFLRGPLPLFITARKGERVRGCMGSLEAKTSSLAEEIERNLKLAFTKDPRHPSIERSEIAGMEIFITVVGRPRPVQRWEDLSPARDGILIRSGMKEAVVLPGEAKTTRYLLAFAKAKAGIKRGESFQLYRVPSLTWSMVLRDDLFSPTPRPMGKEEANPPPPGATLPAMR
jgi:AMMECR1 domain-containing protein